jgi:hypothetical protein
MYSWLRVISPSTSSHPSQRSHKDLTSYEFKTCPFPVISLARIFYLCRHKVDLTWLWNEIPGCYIVGKKCAGHCARV